MDLSAWFNFHNLGIFTAWFVGSFFFNSQGITLGYHRLLTHKALKVPKFVMYYFVTGGYLALMGAPISCSSMPGGKCDSETGYPGIFWSCSVFS